MTDTALTHARVVRMAVPVVLSNASVPLIGLVDTGVVGQIGAAAPIGAVGLGAVVLSSVYWIFGFLRMGTTGLVGQALGREDQAEVAAVLTRALLIALGAGALIIVLRPLILFAAFSWDPTTPEIEELTRQYISIRVWSAPCIISVYALTGWLVAQERTGAMFAVQLGMNGVNAVLDIWFVLGLGWGVQGVAIATVLAEATGLALAIYFCRGAFAHQAWRDWPRVLARKALVQMAALNTDILIRSVLLLAIFNSFIFLSAGFDPVTLAANHVLLLFLHTVAYAMDGFAFTAEALVAKAVGQSHRGNLRRSIYLTSVWGLGVCAALSATFWIFGPDLIALMAKVPEVQARAADFLPWMVAAPLIGWGAWMLDGIFIGATRGRDMRNMMIVSAAVYAVSVAALIPIAGNHGLWAALLISFAVRAATLATRYPALERDAVSVP